MRNWHRDFDPSRLVRRRRWWARPRVMATRAVAAERPAGWEEIVPERRAMDVPVAWRWLLERAGISPWAWDERERRKREPERAWDANYASNGTSNATAGTWR